MRLYDTHCHPYLAQKKSQEMILENFFCGGGVYLNTIGIDITSNNTCIQLAKKNKGVYATIGIHPTHSLDYKGKLDETIQELKEQYTEHSKYVVAIGETGLDYHWLESLSQKYKLPKEEIIQIQKDFFIAQIRLAEELSLPLVIHNRKSSTDIFEILQQENCTNFVFHCFSEDLEFATKLIEFAPECKLGFGGVTTFKSAETIMKAAASIPLKNIIIETDSPYLTPIPYRGKQENEPLYVKYVLDKIIDLRKESPEEIGRTIFENSVEFFGVK